MTTLRTRWEKPDYTGVIAEVPLRHVPHLKSPNQPRCFSSFDLPDIQRTHRPSAEAFRFTTDATRPGPSPSFLVVIADEKRLAVFWTVYSPVSGTRQIGKLAKFFYQET
jgi:hypothetical protein